MRNLIVGLVLLLSGSALGCDIERAQVIGKVIDDYDVMTSENTSECFYQIQFSQFSPDFNCPLDIEDVLGVEFLDLPCKLENGDSVSGVLAKKGARIYFE